MKNRPWLIKVIMASLFIVPLTAILCVFTSARESGVPADATVILDVWVIGVGTCIAALGIWRVRPWGFFTFFGFVLGVMAGDLYHIYHNPGTVRTLDYVDGAVAAMCLVFILQKHAAAPYFNPKIRWWETATRHKVDLEATVVVADANFPTQVLDISETGCFVRKDAPDLSQGQVVNIGIRYNHFYFESPVRVIRHSAQPSGVGLMFVDTNKQNRRELKRMIRALSRSGIKSHPLMAA